MKFDEWLRRKGVRPLTVRAYTQDVKAFQRWFLQTYGCPFDFKDFTHDVVRRWWGAMEAEGMAARTRNRRLAALRQYTRWAQEEGLLAQDPTAGIKRAVLVPPPPRSLTGEEWRRLVEVVERGAHIPSGARNRGFLYLRDRALFALLARLGLRVAEAVSVRVEDLDIDAGRLRVLGKGGIEGWVMVPPSVLVWFREWLDVRPQGQTRALLTTSTGDAMTPDAARKRVQSMGKAAGIARLQPHMLRHTFVERFLKAMLEGGVGPEVALDAARRQARHRDSRTTLAYLRARGDQIREALEAMG